MITNELIELLKDHNLTAMTRLLNDPEVITRKEYNQASTKLLCVSHANLTSGLETKRSFQRRSEVPTHAIAEGELSGIPVS
jgi:hypothetical protein